MDHTVLCIWICVILSLQLIFLSNVVNAIKCWNCQSDIDSKCADPFDNSSFPIMDCSQSKELPHLPGIKANSCRKIRQKVNGEWRYIRSCAYLGEAGIQGDQRFCLMRTGTYDIFIEYCTCDYKDGCNSSLPLFRLDFISLSLLLVYSFFLLR